MSAFYSTRAFPVERCLTTMCALDTLATLANLTFSATHSITALHCTALQRPTTQPCEAKV